VIRFKTKVVLADRNMTQRELWEQTGVRPPTISAMCTGSARQIPVDVLEKMCRVLKCQPGDLLEFIPEETQEGE
jgi:putative transcriptional regulator